LMMDFALLAADVKSNLPDVRVLTGEYMRDHTSFRIGGPVPVMFIPQNAGGIPALCAFLTERGVHPLIVGNGTNLLVEDAELDFAVIKTAGIPDELHITGENEITASSGVLLSRLAVFAQQNALTGLEFAHGIPGTLGGAVSMNAGAYGGEIKDAAVSTRAYNAQRGEYTVTGNEHDFAYRHSVFSDTEDVVLSTVLKLQPGDPAEIRAKMDDLSVRRRTSQPLDMPSAGSTFKRPKNGYAAAMIDGAGLKGYAIGGAQVSPKHAGFVVNTGNATFDDVMRLMDHVRETVFKQYGTELEPEVKIIRSGRSFI